MLDEHGIRYRYREYRKEPLSAAEIRALLKRLGLQPKDVLRTRDPAFKDQGLTGNESAERLVSLMAKFPTLLQRPIGVLGSRAVIGRPPSNLLDLVGG